MQLSYHVPDRGLIRRKVLSEVPMYNTDFEVKSTPSFSRCIDAIVEMEIDYNERCARMQIPIFKKWARHLSEKKAKQVCVEVNRAITSGPDTAKKMRDNPPKYLSATEKKLFKELMEVSFALNCDFAVAKFPIESTPCMFEPRDIEFDGSTLLDPSRYRPQWTKFGLQYNSRRIVVRNVMDPQYPMQRIQSIDFSVTVAPEKEVVMKYTVFNRNDKLDSVVVVGDRLVPSHYHVELKTKRGEKNFYLSFEILKSSKSGNFTMKYEDASNTFPCFVNSQDMMMDPMYRILSRYPIFMGGNAFLSIADFVKGHKAEIVDNLAKYTTSI